MAAELTEMEVTDIKRRLAEQQSLFEVLPEALEDGEGSCTTTAFVFCCSHTHAHIHTHAHMYTRYWVWRLPTFALTGVVAVIGRRGLGFQRRSCGECDSARRAGE